MKRGRGWSECRIANLPEEILIDIFSRLSVKTIFTCRCVSKTWHNLLSSSNTHFTKLHFNRSPLQFILQTSYYGKCFTYLVELQDDTHLDSIKPLPSKFQLSSPTYYAVNSCNGFLCLTTFRNCFNPVKICNPITGEYFNLPKNKMDDFLDCHVRPGFGRSAKTNQYKVVRLVRREGEFKDMMVEVYTIGTKSWRNIGTAPKFSDGLVCTTFFNGAIHWVCYDNRSSHLIISFDLESEKFGIVPPPPHSSAKSIMNTYCIKIGVFGEFLYVMHNTELWVMKEYGVQESWTKVCVVDRPFERHQAIKYLSGGQILMNKGGKKLISYDPVEKIYKEFELPKSFGIFETIAHVPSFMSFNDAMMGDKGAKLPTRMCRVRIEGRDKSSLSGNRRSNQILHDGKSSRM